MISQKINSVDEYMHHQSPEIQTKLDTLRSLVKKVCPEAIESISYAMPAYKLKGKPLIYFAGYEHHIGLYATPSGHSAFAKELAGYKQGKGSVQFPLDKEMPRDLIAKILQFKKEEILKG